MKNNSLTKKDLDQVVKKISDSIQAGFKEARKERTSMEKRLTQRIDENQSKSAEIINKLKKTQLTDQNRIDKIFITGLIIKLDLNNIREQIETIKRTLCI